MCTRTKQNTKHRERTMVEKHGQERNQKIIRTVQNRSGSVDLDWDFALRLRPSPLRVASQLRLNEDSWCNAAEGPPKRRCIMTFG